MPRVTKHQVLSLIATESDITTAEIAQRLQCSKDYVRATLSRNRTASVRVLRKAGVRSTWSDQETLDMLHMRDVQAMSWDAIGKALGRPLSTCSAKYRVENLPISTKRCVDRTIRVMNIPDEIVRDAHRRNMADRSITSQFFGDPAPGQSALDKKQGEYA